MKTLLKKEEPGLPLGKILIVVVAVVLVIGFGVQCLMNIENRKSADKFYAEAKDHFENSRMEAGLTAIDRALKFQETPAYLETKLDILINQNKPYEALLLLDKLIGLEPKNAHYHSLSGRIAYNQSETEKALTQYLEATRLAPENAQYQVELANIYFQKGDSPAGAERFKALIHQDAHYRHAWNQYILALLNTGQSEASLKVVQDAIRQFPSDSDFYFLLGSVQDRLGHKKEAVSAYYRSLELEPLENSIAAARILKMTGKRVPLRLENMASDQVAFQKKSNVMFVKARVNQEPGTFLLDTGASMSVIYQSKMKQYGVMPGPFRIEAQTANGIVQARIGYANVQMGRFQENTVMFAILPDPENRAAGADGIIGMNFLGKFRFEIDQDSRKLTLKR